MTRVTLGKSRVRESRPPGSVRAKAKWLSYSTTIEGTRQSNRLRYRPDVARRRAQWTKYQGRVEAERLVFIDETWI